LTSTNGRAAIAPLRTFHLVLYSSGGLDQRLRHGQKIQARTGISIVQHEVKPNVAQHDEEEYIQEEDCVVEKWLVDQIYEVCDYIQHRQNKIN
jgi:hypothetical protein